MANRPQDYVTPNGRMTTNTVEGFHGLVLMYRGKQIDLEQTHYTCKTNMAILSQGMYTYIHTLLSTWILMMLHRIVVQCGRHCVA